MGFNLCIPTSSFSPGSFSGISNTVNLLSRMFVEYGINVSIYAPKFIPNLRDRFLDGIDMRYFSYIDVLHHECTFSPSMFNAIRKGDFDLIHSFHYAYFPATAGYLAAKIKKLPHIFTTSYHPKQITRFKTFLMKIYNITQGRCILSGSDMVLPQNYHELKHLKRIAKCKCKIIPCPINSDIFYHQEIKNKLTILYVGSFLPWKGADTAFNICKEIERERKDIRFVFVGSGPLEKKLKSKASKRFRFMKNLSVRELAREYNKADLILYPTKYESFGRVLAEAELCGTPVISTRVGAVPETVGPGGFLVDYGDWEKMRGYALWLLDNSKERKSLSRKAIRHAQQYKDKIVANKIFRIYKKILK